MEFLEVIQKRRSVRAYIAQSTEREKVQTILNAANHAPSAGNKQGYEIFAVTSRKGARTLR